MNDVIKSNKVVVRGEIVSDFEYNHEVYGEKFYQFLIAVKRLSDKVDVFPLIVSERLIDVTADLRGVLVEVTGQFRSYNSHKDFKTRLMLAVFAREVKFIDVSEVDVNEIYLDGYICKPPIYRKTPLGREIADLLIAVNRPYGKSDYIPCISWGRNACYAGNLDVGTHIQINGRIQSREYKKKTSDEEFETRVAYEVSICRITKVELEEEEANE